MKVTHPAGSSEYKMGALRSGIMSLLKMPMMSSNKYETIEKMVSLEDMKNCKLFVQHLRKKNL